jgi:membrane-associated protease RseP (regulator of RpoE activity)
MTTNSEMDGNPISASQQESFLPSLERADLRRYFLSESFNELTRGDGRGPQPALLDYEPPQESRRRLRIQVLLFVLTVLSTALVGGWAYSGFVILILLFHEMGHYFAARYYGVRATLPFFIPFPLSIFGTFGAVIKMQSTIPNRRALFDIGIMGPAMGLVIALPASVYGIAMSQVIQVKELPQQVISLGDSVLFSVLARWIQGPLPEGYDLLLHPIGFAGWAGLFVTALNLLPMGQLDGGHIVYAMLQRKSVLLYRTVFAAFAVFTIVGRHPQWIVFLAMVLFMIRLKHPPTLNEDLPIGRWRFVFGIAALLFFAITFPPIPIKL